MTTPCSDPTTVDFHREIQILRLDLEQARLELEMARRNPFAFMIDQNPQFNLVTTKIAITKEFIHDMDAVQGDGTAVKAISDVVAREIQAAVKEQGA